MVGVKTGQHQRTSTGRPLARVVGLMEVAVADLVLILLRPRVAQEFIARDLLRGHEVQAIVEASIALHLQGVARLELQLPRKIVKTARHLTVGAM